MYILIVVEDIVEDIAEDIVEDQHIVGSGLIV